MKTTILRSCASLFFLLTLTGTPALAQTKSQQKTLELADIFYSRQKFKDARPLYMEFSSALTPVQQARLGISWLGTSEAKPDEVAKAMSWIQKGASGGSTEAMNVLSVCYGAGIGVEKDPEQEIFWLQKSADKGDDKALASLGYRYQVGTGVTADKKKALELYKASADKGNAQAAYYVSAIDKFENPTASTWHWLKKSAEGDYLPAMLKLGELYENTGEPDEAVRWYTKVLATKGFTAEHRAARQRKAAIGAIEPSTDINTLKPLLMKLISAAANDYNGTLKWEKDPLTGRRVDVLSTSTYYTTTLDLGFKNALVQKEVVQERNLEHLKIKAATNWSYSADIVYDVSEETALRVFEEWVELLKKCIPQWKTYRSDNKTRPTFTIGGNMTNGKNVTISISVSGFNSENVGFHVSNR